jgi:hypothetical protein
MYTSELCWVATALQHTFLPLLIDGSAAVLAALHLPLVATTMAPMSDAVGGMRAIFDGMRLSGFPLNVF